MIALVTGSTCPSAWAASVAGLCVAVSVIGRPRRDEVPTVPLKPPLRKGRLHDRGTGAIPAGRKPPARRAGGACIWLPAWLCCSVRLNGEAGRAGLVEIEVIVEIDEPDEDPVI